jgi:hypothetical protein
MKKKITPFLVTFGLLIATVASILAYRATIKPDHSILQNEFLEDPLLSEDEFSVQYNYHKDYGELLSFVAGGPLKGNSLISHFEQKLKRHGWEECSYGSQRNGWDSFIDMTKGYSVRTLQFIQYYKKDNYTIMIGANQPLSDNDEIAVTLFAIHAKEFDDIQCI